MKPLERRNDPPLLVMNGNIVVAGYFDSGKYVSVTFQEYLSLAMETAKAGKREFPEYLKVVEGFWGARFVTPMIPGMPEIAIPVFGREEAAP
jgi:hypothetical protein